MEIINPLLQPKIMQQQEISKPNKNNRIQFGNLALKSDTFELNKSEEENIEEKNTKTKTLADAIALAAKRIIKSLKEDEVKNPSERTPDKIAVEETEPAQEVAKLKAYVKELGLPEYLYHITSEDSLEKIKASGVIKVSTGEYISGVFLLDNENFITHYCKTQTSSESYDLFTTMFRHILNAYRRREMGKHNIAIIKIPTLELLKSGNLKVRTLEDYMTCQERVFEINQRFDTDILLRKLSYEWEREKFKKFVLGNKIMTPDELEQFFSDINLKLQEGYPPQKAKELSKTNSIEYVFDRNIKLSEVQNIQTLTVNLKDYCDKSKKLTVLPQKFKTVFEQEFNAI